MAYAQIQYPQKLGSGPTTLRIADIGCLLAAFSNLLERFGEGIDPPALNNFFIQHGTYMADGPDRDLLGFGSVSAYDGSIAVAQIGADSWPQTNNAIVKFVYKNARTGQKIPHFCLVADHTQRVILDSWDGQTKVSPYGNPVAWASYDKHAPQAVPAPPAPTVPAFTVETIPTMTKVLKIDTHLWNLSYRTWQDMVNNPVKAGGTGFQFQTSQIAHHVLGGSYYMPSGGDGNQGYNTVDCKDPEAPPMPIPPAVEEPKAYTQNTVDGIAYSVLGDAPKAMYIAKAGGAEKWSFKDVATWRQFKSVEHVAYGTQIFVVGSALHPIPPSGALYYMLDPDFGDFKRTGKVANQCGFNKVDLSETKPPELPIVAPASLPVPIPTLVAVAPADWKNTYLPLPKPIRYVSTRDQDVYDLSRPEGVPLPLPKYEGGKDNKMGLVAVYGSVIKDGTEYDRLKAGTDTDFNYWYCVPKVDPNTRTPNLLLAPGEAPGPISKLTVAQDKVVLVQAHLGTSLSALLHGIISKFQPHKK